MNKSINNVILASVFIVPMASVIPIHGTIVWYPQLLAIMAIGFICLALIFWDTNKFISIFLIYVMISYLLICSQSPRSMLCLITGYAGIIFSYFVSQSDVSKIYKLLIWIVGINAVLFILQVFKIDPIFISGTNILIDRTVGFMGSRNQLGIFHASNSLLLMTISPWLILTAIPILIIKCSSAFGGLMIGLSTYLFFIHKKILSFLIIAVLLISIPIFIHSKEEIVSELKERFQLWELTLKQAISGKIIEDGKENPITNLHREVSFNPWFGCGIGNFFVFSPMSQGILWEKNTHPTRYEHAHNDFIEAFLEFGYLGILLILLCISKIISDFLSCLHLGHPNTSRLIITFSTLVSLAICSLGIYVFHAPVSLFLFCLTLGLFYGEVRNAKQGQIATNTT